MGGRRQREVSVGQRARLRVVGDLVEVRPAAREEMLCGEDREDGCDARRDDEQDEHGPPGPGVAVDRRTLSHRGHATAPRSDCTVETGRGIGPRTST